MKKKDFNATTGLDRRKEFNAPDRERARAKAMKKKDFNAVYIKRELLASES